jgi:hypothetical protein
MLRGQKKIDANNAKIARAEENIAKWKQENAKTQEHMGTPKYMVDPFKAHLSRLPQDVLHSKALKQYGLDQIDYIDDNELIDAMIEVEFDLDSLNAEVEEAPSST